MKKIMFVSDLHGSVRYTEIALEKFLLEKADYLVLLGDLRNEYNKSNSLEVAKLLNEYKDKIIAIRGNCDTLNFSDEYDFDNMEDFKELKIDGRKIFITHGHIYNEYILPSLNKGDIFIQGHLHIPIAKKVNDFYILSPGSIAEPRKSSKNSYGILENNKYMVKDLMGGIVKEIDLEC
ncbi:MAG: phosphodiesterase [Lachnospirales bacterium]